MMTKNLKTLIKLALERQQEIDVWIADIKDKWGEENVIFSLFLNAPSYCISHPKGISLLADFLQTINKEELLKDFELKDIETLYKLNLDTLPQYISQYEDLGYYYNNVMDDKQKSNDIVNMGYKILTESLEIMKAILKDN